MVNHEMLKRAGGITYKNTSQIALLMEHEHAFAALGSKQAREEEEVQKIGKRDGATGEAVKRKTIGVSGQLERRNIYKCMGAIVREMERGRNGGEQF